VPATYHEGVGGTMVRQGGCEGPRWMGEMVPATDYAGITGPAKGESRGGDGRSHSQHLGQQHHLIHGQLCSNSLPPISLQQQHHQQLWQQEQQQQQQQQHHHHHRHTSSSITTTISEGRPPAATEHKGQKEGGVVQSGTHPRGQTGSQAGVLEQGMIIDTSGPFPILSPPPLPKLAGRALIVEAPAPAAAGAAGAAVAPPPPTTTTSEPGVATHPLVTLAPLPAAAAPAVASHMIAPFPDSAATATTPRPGRRLSVAAATKRATPPHANTLSPSLPASPLPQTPPSHCHPTPGPAAPPPLLPVHLLHPALDYTTAAHRPPPSQHWLQGVSPSSTECAQKECAPAAAVEGMLQGEDRAMQLPHARHAPHQQPLDPHPHHTRPSHHLAPHHPAHELQQLLMDGSHASPEPLGVEEVPEEDDVTQPSQQQPSTPSQPSVCLPSPPHAPHAPEGCKASSPLIQQQQQQQQTREQFEDHQNGNKPEIRQEEKSEQRGRQYLHQQGGQQHAQYQKLPPPLQQQQHHHHHQQQQQQQQQQRQSNEEVSNHLPSRSRGEGLELQLPGHNEIPRHQRGGSNQAEKQQHVHGLEQSDQSERRGNGQHGQCGEFLKRWRGGPEQTLDECSPPKQPRLQGARAGGAQQPGHHSLTPADGQHSSSSSRKKKLEQQMQQQLHTEQPKKQKQSHIEQPMKQPPPQQQQQQSEQAKKHKECNRPPPPPLQQPEKLNRNLKSQRQSQKGRQYQKQQQQQQKQQQQRHGLDNAPDLIEQNMLRAAGLDSQPEGCLEQGKWLHCTGMK